MRRGKKKKERRVEKMAKGGRRELERRTHSERLSLKYF